MFPLAAVEWADPNALKSVFLLALPESALLAFACVIFLGGTVIRNRNLWASVSLVGLLVAVSLAWRDIPSGLNYGAGPLLPDRLAEFVRYVAFAGGILLVLLAWGDLKDDQAADFFACFLILIAGVSLVGAANELVTLFLSLELISIPTYVLLYLPKAGTRAQEAAIKYFLLSIFSSGLLLFGLSYLYGAFGTTNLTSMFQQPDKSAAISGLALVAFVMVIAGLGFRITAVPFHFYAPDVIQGAPTSLGALLAFLPKVAGFAALMRVLGYLHAGSGPNAISGVQISLLLWLLAAVTMTVGNVLAVLQDNLKRILAYSSVAHGGYMLMGMAAAPELKNAAGPEALHGSDAVLFYLVTYGAMTLGAFAVIGYLSGPQRDVETVDDVAGLGRGRPGLALLLGLFLFSLIGLPLTAGFSGKFLLFFSALAVERSADQPPFFVILAVVGAINAAIGAYYYLRIIAAMFLREAAREWQPRAQLPTAAVLAACAVVTILLGVYPSLLVQPARLAVTAPAPALTAQAQR